jgi:hypothetical protein
LAEAFVRIGACLFVPKRPFLPVRALARASPAIAVKPKRVVKFAVTPITPPRAKEVL